MNMARTYPIDGWMIAWSEREDSKPGAVEVGPWPDKTGWSDHYENTAGCCNAEWSELSQEEKLQHLVTGFLVLVLGDGIDPQAVHREFLKIEGYAEMRAGYLGMGKYVLFQDGRCDPYNP